MLAPMRCPLRPPEYLVQKNLLQEKDTKPKTQDITQGVLPLEMKFSILYSTAVATTCVASGAALEKRAYGPAPSTGDVCPAGQGFFYKGNSGKFYQVACAVDVSGGTLLAVYPNIPGVVGCAA